MNTLKLIALATIAIIFASCKSTQPTGPPSGGTASLLEVTSILDSAQSHFIQYVNWNGGDPGKAIQLTADWLEIQPNVSSAFTLDNIYITIQLKSGLETYFNFEQVDDSGYSVLRGGGGIADEVGEKLVDPISDSRRTPSAIQATHTITNKKVLLFEAGAGSLNVEPQIKRTLAWLNNSGLGLDVTVLRGIQCSVGVVESFKDYGFVIMDTHGMPNSFLVGSKLDLSSTPLTEDALKSLVEAQAGAGTSSDLASGKLKLGASVKANPKWPNWLKVVLPTEKREFYYSSKSLDLLPPMPSTIIFGNFCNSGFMTASGVSAPAHLDTFPDGSTHLIPARTWNVDGPIGLSFVNKGLISYYAYIRDIPPGASRSVPDPFAIRMEDSLVHRLMKEDSTGIANLASDNKTEFYDPEHLDFGLKTSLFFRHFGADNYRYCVDTFTDARDGHLYHAVCIGSQNWMSENLDYYAPGSECYDSLSGNCDTYGRLYPWKVAMAGAKASDALPSAVQGVCPKGWHLPSAGEWWQLINALGGANAGGLLKSTSSLWNSPNTGATDSSRFSGLPGGSYSVVETVPLVLRSYSGLGLGGYFLSTSINAMDTTVKVFSLINSSTQYNTTAFKNPQDPNQPPANASCRCLRDP